MLSCIHPMYAWTSVNFPETSQREEEEEETTEMPVRYMGPSDSLLS